jgi:RimJ/RimL family protein N-acetyltransferase
VYFLGKEWAGLLSGEPKGYMMTLPIVTERLVLRRYTHDDIPDVLGFVSHPSLASVTSGRIQATEEGVRTYIDLQNSYQPFQQNKIFELAVERQEDGKVIGMVGLIRQDHRQGEIGWALGVEYRGQGYATEAASALMDNAFHSLGLHRIYADTNSDNLASLRLMERLGMRREALLRGSVYEKGKWLDQYIYGILADEWRDTGASGRVDPSVDHSVRIGSSRRPTERTRC